MNLAPLPLFAPPPIETMVRKTDPGTSLAAAKATLPTTAKLKERVHLAFIRHGPMTDGELEMLPELAGIPINSIRKRRTDLYRDGILEATELRRGHPLRPRSMMCVWARSTGNTK